MSADARTRFFDAAHEILSTEGYGALKQAAVCQRVGVTTGAFYHTFKSWQEFTEALLDDWLRERTQVIADLARQLNDPVNQLEALREAAISLRHGSEAAIRIWAGTDANVAAVQLAVDEGRFEVVNEIMRRLVGAKDAPRYAWWGIGVLVGYEQVSYRQTPEDLRWQLDQVLKAAADRHAARSKARRASA
jgi:AcrR family transcriptional regulator